MLLDNSESVQNPLCSIHFVFTSFHSFQCLTAENQPTECDNAEEFKVFPPAAFKHQTAAVKKRIAAEMWTSQQSQIKHTQLSEWSGEGGSD